MNTTVDELLITSNEVEIQASAGKLPSVSIMAYSSGMMVVPGWGPVAIDLAGLSIPLLFRFPHSTKCVSLSVMR